jgi:hypothetical protein
MKPNYMLIGASKCATSSICHHLGQHPDVFMTEPKEPFFFSHDEVYERGFDWYESLYEQAGDRKMRGEGSNTYTMKEVFPQSISRIVSYTTDLKLIYVARHPINRIESYWLEIRSHGGETVHYNFNTAVRVNRDWLVDSSNYWQQINVYRQYFPDNRISIVFYEDFQDSPEATMRRCFEFLDVDPDVPLSNPHIRLGRMDQMNSGSSKLVPKETLSRLREYSLFRASVKLIPESVREPLKKQFLFQKIQSRPQWNLQNRQWVADILEEDTRKFLEYASKPVDFWHLRDRC